MYFTNAISGVTEIMIFYMFLKPFPSGYTLCILYSGKQHSVTNIFYSFTISNKKYLFLDRITFRQTAFLAPGENFGITSGLENQFFLLEQKILICEGNAKHYFFNVDRRSWRIFCHNLRSWNTFFFSRLTICYYHVRQYRSGPIWA